MSKIRTSIVTTLLVLGAYRSASAQVFNPTINPAAAPVVNVMQTDEKAAVRPTAADQRLVNIAFGATANAGNSKTYGANLGGRFNLVHNMHQFTTEALGNIAGARATNRSFSDVTWTARNVIARVRYDLFLSQMDAVFIAMAPRRDKFAGLGLRLQNQIGYSRNLFFPVDTHRFWTEVGYDFTYDDFVKVEGAGTKATTPTTPTTPMQSLSNGVTRGDKPLIHSARLFFGYTNRLSPTGNLQVGVENLFDFQDYRNVRVNGLVEFTSSITHTFKLGLQSRVMFDNVPVAHTKKYDALTVAQLVYTFDSNATTVVTTCPVCDCTAQVRAAKMSCQAPPPPREPLPLISHPIEAVPMEPAVAPVPESVPTPLPPTVPSADPVSVPAQTPLPTP